MSSGKLYMIPVPLGKFSSNNSHPPFVLEQIRSLKHFAVESLPGALRFLQWVGDCQPAHTISFYELHKRTPGHELMPMLKTLQAGHDLGVLSDAGCPGIADPGAALAELAHKNGIQVVPFVGPNSMILALMASGLNGQSFAFSGYLPMKKEEREQKIKELETSSRKNQRTELFMEAPQRNHALMSSLIAHLQANTQLCVACDINMEGEWIRSKSVANWKTQPNIPEKRPCIFLIQAQ